MGDTNPLPKNHHLDRRAHQLLAAAPEADDLLNTPQTAAWLGVSLQWLEIGRSKGYGPPFIKMGPRLVRYKRSEVRAWLRDRRKRARARAEALKAKEEA